METSQRLFPEVYNSANKGCAFLQLKKRLIAKVLFCFRKAEYKTASLSVPDLAIYYSNTTLGVRVCFNNIEKHLFVTLGNISVK